MSYKSFDHKSCPPTTPTPNKTYRDSRDRRGGPPKRIAQQLDKMEPPSTCVKAEKSQHRRIASRRSGLTDLGLPHEAVFPPSIPFVCIPKVLFDDPARLLGAVGGVARSAIYYSM